MAPKSKQLVPDGPSVYIAYVVSRISALTQDDQDAPECTVTLRAPTLDEPCTSEPCQASDVGSYQLDFKAESQHSMDVVAESLDKLLNGFVDVDVSISGNVVAHAHLDLLPVAQGSASVQARLHLVSASDSNHFLRPNSSITIAAHLTQDNEDSLPDNLVQGAEGSHHVTRVPFQFLEDREVSESSVASVSCQPMTDLPSGLLTAADSAGGMQICLGLIWLSENSAHGFASAIGSCDGQVFQKGRECRTLLRRSNFLSLRDAAASGGSFYVEIGRYVAKPELGSDPAYSNYHALARLPDHALRAIMSPGCKTISFEVSFQETFSAVCTSAGNITTVLPPRPPDASKAKPVQQPLPALPSGAAMCGWEETIFSVEVKFTQAVLPEWQPPPKPTKPLSEILPERRSISRTPGASALGQYKDKLQSIGARLISEYIRCRNEADTEGVLVQPDGLRQKLVFELNRSGLYVNMKEQLRSCVDAISKQKFDSSSHEEMIPFCSKIYACMLDEMHAWLKQVTGQSVARHSVPAGTIVQLVSLASECEIHGDKERSMRMHEERLLVDDSCAAWCACAKFCFRHGDVDKGEECIRQALTREPADLQALVILACVCWYKHGAVDPVFMDDAIAVCTPLPPIMGHVMIEPGTVDIRQGVFMQLAHEAIDKCGHKGLPWALLTMLLDASCPEDTKAAEVRNAQHKAQDLASTAQDGQPSLESMPFLELESLLLDLHFGDKALETHSFTVKQAGAETVKTQVNMCKAQALAMTGDTATAVSILTNVVRSCGSGGSDQIAANVLLGRTHEQAGQTVEAQRSFEAALQAGPQCCPLEVYLKLGNMYLHQGKHQYAADVYMQACCSHPCASAWLGLGIAYIRLGRLADADMVLSEANTCDGRNSLVWGYLSLVHVLVENHAEASESLDSAHKHGFKDMELLQEIGETYAQQGRFHDASCCLKQVVAQPQFATYRAFAMLGEAYAECQEPEAARAAWASALAMATEPEDVECANAAMSEIDIKLGAAGDNRLISSTPIQEAVETC